MNNNEFGTEHSKELLDNELRKVLLFIWGKINEANKELLIDHYQKSLAANNRFDIKEIIIGYQYNTPTSLNDSI